ncbi:MAG TPA: acetyl-CoA carboxylase carboxyltransferase subunit alpha [Caulobacter sp.]|nr:acetyl-CoA carboxylase carboxyltransferase subunit alpha [Caulobacter sp.]
MVHHYLEFERPIAELEGKIEELSRLSETAGAGSFDSEIDALRTRLGQLRRESYAALTPWQKAQVARHPERPHFVNYLDGLIEEFVELRGDRKFADDQAIMGGLGRFRGMPVMVIGQEKGHDTTTRLKHNFGMARPEGYRKAVRLMDMAEQFNLPVLTFVDTAGAYPGLGAEERGQAEAIARGTERCLTLKTPMIATVTGEGMSGGAIGIAAGNKVLILEHGIYSVISPEGAASILWRDGARAKDAAEQMHITAQDLIKTGVVDRIIDEPAGGAHSDPETTVQAVGDAIEEELRALSELTPDQLLKQRADRYYAIGRQGLS